MTGPGFPEPAFDKNNPESIAEFFRTHNILDEFDLVRALTREVPVGRLRSADPVLGDMAVGAAIAIDALLDSARRSGLTPWPTQAREEE